MKASFLLFFCILQLGAFSDNLTWAKEHLELEVQSLDETVKAEFTFTNNSKSEVTILEIKTNCNCILVEFPRVIKPNEKAKIVFSARNPYPEDDFYGSIRINTDESTAFDYALTFKFKNTLSLKKYPLKYVQDYRFVQKILSPANSFEEQTYCPLNNKKIEKSLFYDSMDRRIYACSQECLSKIKLKPLDAIIKLSSKGQVPPKPPHKAIEGKK